MLVDDAVLRPRDTVTGGEWVEITIAHEEETSWQPQAIPLDIVYEDESIIVINKPAGLVVHPGAGNSDGTLGNALLHYAPELENVPRAGIVHRLDKDTSGLLVVARNLESQTHLVTQLQDRSVSRRYQALVCGVMTAGGTVDLPIGRHPTQRMRMAVINTGVRDGPALDDDRKSRRGRGKQAITHYRVEQRFRAHTLINVQLETGRTHQIRVHMAHIHYPIVGDPIYGGRLKIPPRCSDELAQLLRGFKRQALHAASLGLIHPGTGDTMEWQAPLPDDMIQLIEAMAADTVANDAEGSQ